jgi:adenylate kinase family enzyme
MANKDTLIINFFGGPGLGKSTLSASLFGRLKMEHVDCELVQEAAKSHTWQKNWAALSNQFYVTAQQHHSQHILVGQVDAVITDSPIILGLFYYKEDNLKIKDAFTTFLVETFKRQNNLNILIKRKKKYNPNGRNQTEKEAKNIDIEIKNFLEFYQFPFIEVDGTPDAIENLYPIVKKHL